MADLSSFEIYAEGTEPIELDIRLNHKQLQRVTNESGHIFRLEILGSDLQSGMTKVLLVPAPSVKAASEEPASPPRTRAAARAQAAKAPADAP